VGSALPHCLRGTKSRRNLVDTIPTLVSTLVTTLIPTLVMDNSEYDMTEIGINYSIV